MLDSDHYKRVSNLDFPHSSSQLSSSPLVLIMADPPRPVSTCWFGENKPSAKEFKPRSGSIDLSDVSCCERKTTLEEALRSFKGKPNLYGFENPLSLILFRANGETIYDEDEALNREICHSHFQSLYSNWSKSKHLRRTRKAGKEITLCSLPSSYHPESRPISKNLVNKAQSIHWLESRGELIHPGLVICVPHMKLFNDYSESMIDFDDNNGDLDIDSQANFDSETDITPSNYCSSLILLISSICKLIGISRLITTEGQWENLSEDTKTRKRRAFRSMVIELAKALVGEHFEDLMSDKVDKPIDFGDNYLHAIASTFSLSKCRKERLQLISILLNVNGICQKKMRETLAITRHQVRKAVAFCNGLYKFEVHRRVKYSKEKVISFIQFLARSNLIATLPFGDIVTTLSDGTFVNVASITRLFSYSQIIKEYLKDLQRTGNLALKLSRTTLYHILRAIARRKNKQLYCVDEFLGEAHMNPYSCPTRHCTSSFVTIEEMENHVFRQDHTFVKMKETILDIAKKEISISIETQEAARISVDESEILTSRSDKLPHEQGWAIKEARAPRMNDEVQEFAKKFFFEHRAEGKRANAAECCELIKNEKTPSGSYRFLLSICPTEKALTSSFGTWENQRLRPKAIASRGGPRKVKQPLAAKRSLSNKRCYDSSDEENHKIDEDEVVAIEEENEEEEEEKIEDESIIASLVEEISNEIFLTD